MALYNIAGFPGLEDILYLVRSKNIKCSFIEGYPLSRLSPAAVISYCVMDYLLCLFNVLNQFSLFSVCLSLNMTIWPWLLVIVNVLYESSWQVSHMGQTWDLKAGCPEMWRDNFVMKVAVVCDVVDGFVEVKVVVGFVAVI